MLGLFRVVTLLANRLLRQGTLPIANDAWYAQQRPMFSDALAAVRRHYWANLGFRTSGRGGDVVKLPKP